jgi:hypothetical protein
MQKYFNSALTDEHGVPWFYQFFVMVYGLKSAVHAVTNIVWPRKAYVHRHRFCFMIFIDDGRIFHHSKTVAAWQLKGLSSEF